MDCEKYKSVLLDSGLDAKGRRVLKEAFSHLESCTGCKEAVDDYDSLRECMVNMQDVPEPEHEIDFCSLFRQQPERPRSVSNHKGLFLKILPLAACVLLAFGLGLLMNVLPSSPEPVQERGHAEAPKNNSKLAFTSQEIKERAFAFKQLNSFYEGQAGWLMTAGNNSDIGLDDKTGLSGNNLLLLRLSLKHADRVLSKVDIVIIPGQTAELSVPLESGHKLSYRVFAKDSNGQLGIYAKITDNNGASMPLAAITTRLQMSQGEVVSIGKLVTNSGNYQLDVAYSQASLGKQEK